MNSSEELYWENTKAMTCVETKLNAGNEDIFHDDNVLSRINCVLIKPLI